MLAGNYNIYCEQGSTFSRFLTIQVPDEVDPSIVTPYDLTGYTARMHVRRTIESATIIAELTTENGLITLGNATGTILIEMPANMTASISTSGVYDLEIVTSGGAVQRVVQGAFNLNQEVTR